MSAQKKTFRISKKEAKKSHKRLCEICLVLLDVGAFNISDQQKQIVSVLCESEMPLAPRQIASQVKTSSHDIGVQLGRIQNLVSKLSDKWRPILKKEFPIQIGNYGKTWGSRWYLYLKNVLLEDVSGRIALIQTELARGVQSIHRPSVSVHIHTQNKSIVTTAPPPNIIVPGCTWNMMFQHYRDYTRDVEIANRLVSYSKRAVQIAEDGPFSKMIEVGKAIVEFIDMLEGNMPDKLKDVKASGLYYAAEGSRLSAERDHALFLDESLANDSKAYCDYAISLAPNHLSALRCLGRVQQAEGELWDAYDQAVKSEYICRDKICDIPNNESAFLEPFFIHELLRILCLKIRCKIGMMDTQIHVTEVEKQDFRKCIEVCDIEHRTYLHIFCNNLKFMYCDYYTTYILLGQAAGCIGESQAMEEYLLYSLKALRMMLDNDESSAFTSTEQHRLHFWIESSRSCCGSDALLEHVNVLSFALQKNDKHDVLRHIDRLVQNIILPVKL